MSIDTSTPFSNRSDRTQTSDSTMANQSPNLHKGHPIELTGDYFKYVENHGGANHSQSSVSVASNDSSMDGVYVYQSDQSFKSTPCRFVKGHVFKRTVLAVIIINTILLGARTYFVPNYTNYTSSNDDDSMQDDATNVSESYSVIYNCMTMLCYLFLGFFTVEVALKIIHYQQHVLRMGWTLVDVFVVVAAWCIGPSLTVFRLTRLKGVFKRISYTQVLIKSLVRVLPQTGGILLILASVFYAFAVILTSFCPIYFTSLGQTMWFLLNLFFLHQWDELSTDVSNQYPHAWILLLIFTIVTTGLLSSLVIAVMTNAVAQTHREQLDKSLDSNGICTKKRRVNSPVRVNPAPMEMMVLLSPPSVAPASSVMKSSDTAMILQYCQRLEAKIDELVQATEQREAQLPSAATAKTMDSAEQAAERQQSTALMNAARAKRDASRSND
ncbi:hypothetical protein MPSEU_000141400 [Mayamaea pseudoterrestris]|nr:hypothetical protein MPSEU_000141400 [Mayamaea pseudoterrestris]